MISFGDNVRVRKTPETEAAGVAVLEGQVYGETTPSVTNVEILGEPDSDFALNVYFEDRGGSFWFAPSLLEFIDHAPGTEIRLEGVPKHWTRAADGSWIEESALDTPKKPWWKFW
jgi:hypothetical protein